MPHGTQVVPHGTVCVPYDTVTCPTAFAECPSAQIFNEIGSLCSDGCVRTEEPIPYAIITMSMDQEDLVNTFTHPLYKLIESNKK